MSSGIVAKLLLGLLVMSFAVWGIGDIFRGGSQTTIATVGGETISAQELDSLIARLQQNMPQITPEIAADPAFRAQALGSLIDNMLLRLESDKTGLDYDRQTLASYIARNPMLQKADGGFNRELFQATLQQNGWSEREYLLRLREDLTTALLRDTVNAGITVPDEMIHTYYAIRNERREANLILLTDSDIGAIKPATAEALELLYKETPQRFTRPEMRTFNYVTFDSEAVWKQLGLEPSDEALTALYEERADDLQVPEQRKVEQLLIDEETDAKAIYQQIAGGMAFDEAATQEKVINKNNISLGTIDLSGLPQSAAALVFALEKNAVSEPIQTDFGWHIFRVTDIIPAHRQTLEEAKPALLADYKAEHMEAEVTQLANSLEDALAAGASLEKALQDARLTELKPETLGPLTQGGANPQGKPHPLAGPQEAILSTAYTLEAGATSSLQMTEKGRYYLVQLKEITPSYLQPLEEVKDQVETLYRQRETNNALRKKATEISDMLKTAENPKAAARDVGLSIHASGELTRMHDTVSNPSQLKDKILTSGFVQELFRLRKHETSGAYPLPSGEYIIGILEAINPAPQPTESELLDLKDELEMEFAGDVMEQYLSHLRDKYKVEVKPAALQGSPQ